MNPRRTLLYVCLCLALAGCSDPQPVNDPAVKASPHHTIKGHEAVVWQVAFSPDGRWLASGSREKDTLGTAWKQLAGERLSGGRGQTVRLWQVSDGSLQQVLSEHSGDVHTAAFSPDSQWLATSGYDNAIILWRLETLAPL